MTPKRFQKGGEGKCSLTGTETGRTLPRVHDGEAKKAQFSLKPLMNFVYP